MSDRLTAMDIENERFRRKMRGFDPSQVLLFLRSVAEEVKRLNLENGDLRDKVGSLEKQIDDHRSREETLQNTLVGAQRMTDEMKDRSKEESKLVVKEARIKAERIVQEGQDQLARLEGEISRCKLERDLFERRLRNLIDEHVTALEQRRSDRDEPDNVHVLRRHVGQEAG
ncbi:MAG: DivIVA domain-containing protein [bacterium]|nr:DivIVA domain-containing protein [bacterium]